ncbi:universal stress protein [Shewanella fidelis]|uniref:Universal stress protein n=1 Tax=Shewanella fidelis TaxID=173509 RepID=A0AAW8NRC4_9GAMM|nr:universal stress protein [Shewanella fidelis]MDR8524940.1 universal stress protein [Shewanella fidelis]MDW4811011.1 universal stress protein [Shewanella fidelis]MDW4815210.1 universal stress protein [Shewanella fidelis]MDW4819300.1 universal stress protein [Shewanella fidelis]MDW4823022.1 universal stress protein [Shewanella fidelis]
MQSNKWTTLMIAYHNTLTLIDNDSAAQEALNKALQLARKTKAKVTALKINRPNNNLLSRLGLIPENALDPMLFVKKLINQYQRQGVEIEVKQLNNVKDHIALIDESTRRHYDLIIINNQHHSLLKEVMPSRESHLLRDSALPIMIVGNKHWQPHGHILTALETTESNFEHNQLNQSLLDDTQQLSRLLNSDIHLVNCYQLENWSMAVTADSHHRSDEEQKQQHWQRLLDKAKHYQLKREHLHLEQGLPDHVIPNVAHKCNANLLVIGAGEHHGLISELKGHTSAVIIDQLKCDILAIKPQLH